MTTDRLESFLERLDKGGALTNYECLRLVMIAQRAAAFTEANDRSDDYDERLDAGVYDEDYEAIVAATSKADDDYNRSKDELFCATRELMGWPGRPAKYLPEFLGGARIPHPFEQEGGE